MTEQLRGKALLAWMVCCVVWGSTYLAIRIGVEFLPPFLFGGIRFVIAGAILATACALLGHAFPRSRADWIRNAGVGLLLLSFGNAGVVWAEQFLPAGLTSVILVSATVWTAAADVLIPGGTTKVSVRLVGSLLLGIVGCVTLIGLSPAELAAADWRGPLALTGSCITWAVGSVWSRRQPTKATPYAASAVQMLVGGAALCLAGTWNHEWARLVLNQSSVGALAYLVTMGSLVGFTAYMYALEHASATVVGTYAYVNPIIAVLLGWLLLHEPITLRMIIGMSIIAVAVAWLQLGGRRAPVPQLEADASTA